ncbi:3-hydroxyacyl-ACP dehydratase FabZ family protein [Stratiformator vulcanicus]|uniref:3-hydroxyacyl-[acyl-carrier-protein] dehydratase FabZ n=1 Tax=Stratiformator vulcanicus TaxID=2527980 RepID=A0A517R0N3_9PLAN|nr:3-hydroxyacyl-ACP dehydratase FabZ family protein [Stratiformator vulcanicus]QDT37428.1 3-hydroxyacyl-[acyl-carrier-protein] dehydratase FabZ [Stratiformator vulcanicus]
MKFQLVDRITELVPGESIAAEKYLTSAEEYLADHFPAFPVMPGVLMVETLVQAGAWLIRATDDFAESTVLLKQARAAKFNNFVSPGQKLIVRLAMQKRGEGETTFKATSEVEGKTAVSCRITLAHFNLADRNEDRRDELAVVDRERILDQRELFGRLWPASRHSKT